MNTSQHVVHKFKSVLRSAALKVLQYTKEEADLKKFVKHDFETQHISTPERSDHSWLKKSKWTERMFCPPDYTLPHGWYISEEKGRCHHCEEGKEWHPEKLVVRKYGLSALIHMRFKARISANFIFNERMAQTSTSPR